MRLKGTISRGVLRGEALLEKFCYRIKAILGFEPYKGTMNIRLEKPVDIEMYSTKTIEHILVDGRKIVEAHLAPVVLHVRSGEQLIDHECWAIKPTNATHGSDMIEVIDKERLKDKFSLKEGDEVEVTFFERRHEKRGPPGMGLMRKLYRREHRLGV